MEKAFQKQQEMELAARQAEKERVERARIEERKRKEVQRITEERKREEERRQLHDSPQRMKRDEMNGTAEEHESANRLSPLKGKEAQENTTSHKSGFSYLFSDRLRRRKYSFITLKNTPSKQCIIRVFKKLTATPDIKRAESMKVDTKKPKRTPSFTTRRRTQSFRKHQRMENLDNLPPVEIRGMLERKHELQSAGKKAVVRSWKQYYTGS